MFGRIGGEFALEQLVKLGDDDVKDPKELVLLCFVEWVTEPYLFMVGKS